MLDQFQVRDLPLLDVVIALESAPLNAVVKALEHGDCRVVLVLDAGGVPRGLVMRDAVLRHAERLSDLRVGLLPALGGRRGVARGVAPGGRAAGVGGRRRRHRLPPR